MGIRVISQTTAEREEEMKQLFEKCKPLMDKGYTLGKAVRKVLKLNHNTFYAQRWFKDLRDYAESQGYRGRY